jgi:hypothetical protein
VEQASSLLAPPFVEQESSLLVPPFVEQASSLLDSASILSGRRRVRPGEFRARLPSRTSSLPVTGHNRRPAELIDSARVFPSELDRRRASHWVEAHMTPTHPTRLVAVSVAVLLAASLTACGPTEPAPEQRAAVEEAVRGYLGALAESYSTLDLSHLEGHASPVEVRNVRNLLQQLANSGDRVEATLVGIEVTGLDIFREVNASVALVEVWDIIRFDPLTGREKGRINGSVQNTLIQLRRIEGDWQVIGRHIVDRETGPGLEGGEEDEGEGG